MTEVTDAHCQKACDELNVEGRPAGWNVANDGNNCALRTVARLIAQQEAPQHPPALVERVRAELEAAMNSADPHTYVRNALAELDALKPDPLVEEAEALSQQYFNSEHILVADMALAALKRGMELERSK